MGFLLTPTVLRSWAPVGQTPILRHFDRRDRISAISGLSVSPKRRRLNLYFRLHHDNIRQGQVVEFLRHLLRHLRGHIVLIWDRSRTHRARLVRKLLSRTRRLHLVALPGYAPELNPDELVWKLAKEILANGRPRNRHDLLFSVYHALEGTRKNPTNLKACVLHSPLPLFLN